MCKSSDRHDDMSSTKPNLWLYCPQPIPNARLRLFCFPYAGVGASIFRRWVEGLPVGVELCAIQLPGRESRLRETPFNRLAELGQALRPILRPYLDRPFALFGHSLGAWIGYELSRQLREHDGLAPAHLFVSGRRAPHRPPSQPPMHTLADAAFLQAMRTRYGGGPEIVWQDAELMQVFLPILRADITMAETYTPICHEPLDCPISAFGGFQDTSTDRSELEDWQELTTRTFQLRLLPGDHFFVNENRRLLLHLIAQDLMLCM
ncbi:Linear gramicidin dehydrogenase LgrE [Candidatus Entotheonellaceae bacterium PAL068K]